MRLILLSDLHLVGKSPAERLDDLTVTQWEKMKFVFDYAQEHKIKYILQAGDFFDVPRHWDLFGTTFDFLKQYPEVQVLSVLGQHDQYMRNTDVTTNRSVLKWLNLIQTPYEDNNGFLTDTGINIYGISFEDDQNIDSAIDKVEAYIKKYPQSNRKDFRKILMIHAPIGNKPLFPGHEYTHAGKLLRKHPSFDVILCGDIHQEFHVKHENRFILNTGPMLRKENNVHNQYHQPCFYIYDIIPGKIYKKVIPHAPFAEIFSQYKSETVNNILDQFVDIIKKPTVSNCNIYTAIENVLKDNAETLSSGVKTILTNLISERKQ